MGETNVEKFLIKRRYQLHKPINRLISVVVVGRGKFNIAEIFSGSVLNELEPTIYPRNFKDFLKNSHFFIFIVKLASFNLSLTSESNLICSSKLGEHMIISSK